MDNDGDGFVDCDDLNDCAGSHPMCAPQAETLCANNLDDDMDGEMNCDDADCASDPACAQPGVENCELFGDEELDGFADCDDDECDSHWSCQSGGSSCGSGGAVDCSNANCTGHPTCAGGVEDCSNLQDDDGDGAPDCADADCAADPSCDGSGSGVPGAACTVAADCLPGLVAPVCLPEMITGAPGGHCAQWCTADGSSGCPLGLNCYTGNSGWGQMGVCVDRCLDLDECGVGQSCRRLGVEDSAPVVCRRTCSDDLDCTTTGLCHAGFEGCVRPELCDNALDDDADGDTDCDDDECEGIAGCPTWSEEGSLCTDGFDNDADGNADCADSECEGAPACPGTWGEAGNCTDGLDNEANGDGYVDCADPECATDAACAVSCPSPVDCAVPACGGDATCLVSSESDCLSGQCCTNFDGGVPVDDDGDGLANCADMDCQGWGMGCAIAEVCDDMDDNDEDLAIDCVDPDCLSDSACASGSGALGSACVTHSDCSSGAGAAPFCLPAALGLTSSGQCLHTCDLTDSATCESGFNCVDLGFGNDTGMCMPGCYDVNDCDGTSDEQCAPFMDFSFGVCVPGCDDDSACPGQQCNTTTNACEDVPPATEDACSAGGCCQGGVDEDLDGDVDCEDLDCMGVDGCPAENCWNGVDDDDSGGPDCFDAACADQPYCIGTDPGASALIGVPCDRTSGCKANGGLPLCPQMGLPFDGTCMRTCATVGEPCGEVPGWVCASAPDGGPNNICFPQESCTDGVDNDWDGDADCADSDCTSHGLCTAACGDGWRHANEACDDGAESGAETWCDDVTCTLTAACSDRADGIDNDGLIDCLDPDCANAPACQAGSVEHGGACDAHSDCAAPDGQLPFCLEPADQSTVQGTCAATCTLGQPWTCSDGADCVDLALGGDTGLCVRSCTQDGDCGLTDRCEPLGLGGSNSACVPGCQSDTDCGAAAPYCNPSDGRCVDHQSKVHTLGSDWSTVPFPDVPVARTFRFEYDAGLAQHSPVTLEHVDRLALPSSLNFQSWIGMLGGDAAQIHVDISTPRTGAGNCGTLGTPYVNVPVDCVDIVVTNDIGIDLGDLIVEVHSTDTALRQHFLPPVLGQAAPSDLSAADFIRPSGNPVWVLPTSDVGAGQRKGLGTLVFPQTGLPDSFDVYVRIHPEICGNDLDDDGDARVDEECRTQLDGEPCEADFDCFMGTCSAAQTCDRMSDFARWNTIDEYDIDLAQAIQTLTPVPDIADWESDNKYLATTARGGTLHVEIGYTPEECGQAPDVFPWDRQGMTCIRTRLDVPSVPTNTDQSIYIEVLDGTTPLYQGTSASRSYPQIAAVDGGGELPAYGYARRLGRLIDGASTIDAVFELPEIDLGSAGDLRVRTVLVENAGNMPPQFAFMAAYDFDFAAGMGPETPGGSVPLCPPWIPDLPEQSPFEWVPRHPGDVCPRPPFQPPILVIDDPVVIPHPCESPLMAFVLPAVYDVVLEFDQILDEIGWTPMHLTQQFVATNTASHLSEAAQDQHPFQYMLEAFGADAIDCAFQSGAQGTPLSELMDPEQCDTALCQYAALFWLAGADQAESWSVLLNPVAPSESTNAQCSAAAEGWDSYWGLRAVLEHASLGNRAQRWSATGPELWGEGTVPLGREYVLPSQTLRVRQFSSSFELPYHGPMPAAAYYGRAPTAVPGPADRFGWPPLELFGADSVNFVGCGARIVSDASTEYLRDVWFDALDPFVTPMCTVALKESGDQLVTHLHPILWPQDLRVSSSSNVAFQDLSIINRFAEGIEAEGGNDRVPAVRWERMAQLNEQGARDSDENYFPAEDGLWFDGDWLSHGATFAYCPNYGGLCETQAECKTTAQSVCDTDLGICVAEPPALSGHDGIGFGPKFELSNVAGVSMTDVNVSGLYNNYFLGGTTEVFFPGSLRLESFEAFDFMRTEHPSLDAGRRFPALTLTPSGSVCGEACMSRDVTIEGGTVSTSVHNNLTLSHVRRLLIDSVRLENAGRGEGLLVENPGSNADWEPNNSRLLPLVVAGDEAQPMSVSSRDTEGRPCERIRSGNATIIDSAIINGLGAAISVNGRDFGFVEDVRILGRRPARPEVGLDDAMHPPSGCVLQDVNDDGQRRGAASVLGSAGARTSVVGCDILGRESGIELWADGADGIFAQNRVETSSVAGVVIGVPAVPRVTADRLPVLAQCGYVEGQGRTPYAECASFRGGERFKDSLPIRHARIEPASEGPGVGLYPRTKETTGYVTVCDPLPERGSYPLMTDAEWSTFVTVRAEELENTYEAGVGCSVRDGRPYPICESPGAVADNRCYPAPDGSSQTGCAAGIRCRTAHMSQCARTPCNAYDSAATIAAVCGAGVACARRGETAYSCDLPDTACDPDGSPADIQTTCGEGVACVGVGTCVQAPVVGIEMLWPPPEQRERPVRIVQNNLFTSRIFVRPINSAGDLGCTGTNVLIGADIIRNNDFVTDWARDEAGNIRGTSSADPGPSGAGTLCAPWIRATETQDTPRCLAVALAPVMSQVGRGNTCVASDLDGVPEDLVSFDLLRQSAPDVEVGSSDATIPRLAGQRNTYASLECGYDDRFACTDSQCAAPSCWAAATSDRPDVWPPSEADGDRDEEFWGAYQGWRGVTAADVTAAETAGNTALRFRLQDELNSQNAFDSEVVSVRVAELEAIRTAVDRAGLFVPHRFDRSGPEGELPQLCVQPRLQ